VEGERVVVFEDLVAGNFATQDARENISVVIGPQGGNWHVGAPAALKRKSFLVLFFKKEHLP
jgi:hypothetical protein